MPELSPAAQAVWNAAYNTPEDCPYEHDLAAVLRAAADQVVPEEPDGGREPRWIRQSVRRKLLSLAAELEAS